MKVDPYWSVNPKTEALDKPVYHIFDDCPEGQKILAPVSGFFTPLGHDLCEICAYYDNPARGLRRLFS